MVITLPECKDMSPTELVTLATEPEPDIRAANNYMQVLGFCSER